MEELGSYRDLGLYEKNKLKQDVIELFMTSHTQKELKLKIQEKWKIDTSSGTFNSLVKKFKEEFFDAEFNKENQYKKEGYLAKYQYLLKVAVDKAVETGNTKNAKELIDSMVKLEGLLTEKQEVKLVDDFKVEF